MEVIVRKKVKTKSSNLEIDFTNFCNVLSEALYLKGLRKSKYLILIPEILYYLIKTIVGVIDFVNKFEPLLTLFSSIQTLSQSERDEFIQKVESKVTRNGVEK